MRANDPVAFNNRGLLRLAESFAPDLSTIRWFSRCGSGIDPSLHGQAVLDATELKPIFESEKGWLVRNTASNDMSLFLSDGHRDLYQFWNDVVAAINSLMQPYENKIHEFCTAHGLADRCRIFTKRDIIDYGIWVYYSELPGLPTTPCRPMEFYRAGRVMCGWRGDIKKWPNVELLYF